MDLEKLEVLTELHDVYMGMELQELYEVAQEEYNIMTPDDYERDELVDVMMTIEQNNRWK